MAFCKISRQTARNDLTNRAPAPATHSTTDGAGGGSPQRPARQRPLAPPVEDRRGGEVREPRVDSRGLLLPYVLPLDRGGRHHRSSTTSATAASTCSPRAASAGASTSCPRTWWNPRGDHFSEALEASGRRLRRQSGHKAPRRWARLPPPHGRPRDDDSVLLHLVFETSTPRRRGQDTTRWSRSPPCRRSQSHAQGKRNLRTRMARWNGRRHRAPWTFSLRGPGDGRSAPSFGKETPRDGCRPAAGPRGTRNVRRATAPGDVLARSSLRALPRHLYYEVYLEYNHMV